MLVQEAPEVNVDTLEKLQGAFRQEKDEVDAEAVKAVQAHNLKAAKERNCS